MRASEAVKAIMRISNVTQKQLAEKWGKAGQSTISMILSARTMKLENLLMVLDECGYELVARSKDGERPEYVIGEEQKAAECVQSNTESIKDIFRGVLREELDRIGYKANEPDLKISIATDDEKGQ